MTRSLGLTLLATGALAIASVIGSPSRGNAQDDSAAGRIKLAEAGGKHRDAPKGSGPRTVAPRTVAPRTVTPGIVTAPRTGTAVTPKRVVAPKTVTAPRVVSPGVVAPSGAGPRVATPPGAGPKMIGPGGPGLRAIGARSSGRIFLGGRNYTVWRGVHRVRYGNRWATLAALGLLGVIVYSGAQYYPYAYVSAVGPYCEGLTPDGCVLQWQEVPTLEGPSILQCVAYCPWQ